MSSYSILKIIAQLVGPIFLAQQSTVWMFLSKRRVWARSWLWRSWWKGYRNSATSEWFGIGLKEGNKKGKLIADVCVRPTGTGEKSVVTSELNVL